jgi:hypothetical protein
MGARESEELSAGDLSLNALPQRDENWELGIRPYECEVFDEVVYIVESATAASRGVLFYLPEDRPEGQLEFLLRTIRDASFRPHELHVDSDEHFRELEAPLAALGVRALRTQSLPGIDLAHEDACTNLAALREFVGIEELLYVSMLCEGAAALHAAWRHGLERDVLLEFPLGWATGVVLCDPHTGGPIVGVLGEAHDGELLFCKLSYKREEDVPETICRGWQRWPVPRHIYPVFEIWSVLGEPLVGEPQIRAVSAAEAALIDMTLRGLIAYCDWAGGGALLRSQTAPVVLTAVRGSCIISPWLNEVPDRLLH